VVVDRGFITVRADLPGIPGENIEVVVLPRYVEIIGWPSRPHPAGTYFVSERHHEVARRTLRLPEEIVPGRSVARLSGGVLEVRIARLPIESGWTGREREA
jgi:HSP20 family molecular chaperone IbpA